MIEEIRQHTDEFRRLADRCNRESFTSEATVATSFQLGASYLWLAGMAHKLEACGYGFRTISLARASG